MKKNLKLMNKYLLIIGITLILIGSINFTYRVFKNSNYDYSNLKVYIKDLDSYDFVTYKYKNKYIKLSNKDKRKIIYYLKKESFKEDKNMYKCIVIGKYNVSFDKYKISFDNDSCLAYMYDVKTKKTKQIHLSNRFEKYIIKITNDKEE